MFIRGIDRYSRHFVVLHGFSRCALLHPWRKSFNYFKSFYVQDRSCALAFRLPLYFYSLIGKGIHSRVNSTLIFFFDFYSSYTLTVDCIGCQELYYSMLTFEFKDIRLSATPLVNKRNIFFFFYIYIISNFSTEVKFLIFIFYVSFGTFFLSSTLHIYYNKFFIILQILAYVKFYNN